MVGLLRNELLFEAALIGTVTFAGVFAERAGLIGDPQQPRFAQGALGVATGAGAWWAYVNTFGNLAAEAEGAHMQGKLLLGSTLGIVGGLAAARGVLALTGQA